MLTKISERPEPGALVQVRGQRWIVSSVDPSANSTLVTIQNVDRYGETLDVIWEIEAGAKLLPARSLPEPGNTFDPPEQLAAFLDAIKWSAVTSADVKTLQAPFRSGVAIEDYQLEPVARAVDAPRVNLLLADDVGLGKTIEAGLVAQELILRHRAKKIMIVCPAGLTTKWKDEMGDKFGLDFTVINSDTCALVRRKYGSAANPFNVYPLSIVSLPWLRSAKAQRLLDEMLPPDTSSHQRVFDLLILDEAHHVAPAAPRQVYAVDSQQTKLIRRLAPHFTNRLFLSATPHNGYQSSFTALLEILDDQRFARGVEPDPTAVKETVVRRLKRDIVDSKGNARFAARNAMDIPVEYPDSEKRVHTLLQKFAKLRRRKLTTKRGKRATDLVTLLLKKRLFSSPAAFAHTVDVYLGTLQSGKSRSSASDEVPEWLEDFFDDIATFDDEELAEAEDDLFGRTRPMQPDAETEEISLLEEMRDWARKHEARADAKAKQLITYLEAVCRPDGKHWTNERVVVFTEYRDTQLWLKKILASHGLGGDHVAELHGGMITDDRELLRVAFQKHPAEHPVRILLATDAASEGIDLQRHCHRLVNYDIPFNPNKLEQRIGRIDRYGQKNTPEIRHFVGSHYKTSADSFEADLEFLSRVAKKVASMEEDLGAVNAVLSDAVQRRMLGEGLSLEVESAGRDKGRLPGDANVREQVRKLRTNLEQTVDSLGITPGRIKRVVDTALELANQQSLTGHIDDKYAAEGMFDVPTLTGSWSKAADRLIDEFQLGQSKSHEVKLLPVTFDPEVQRGRDDVVLAHLNHTLVRMSTGLLTRAATSDRTALKRVTAVISNDPALEDVLIGAYSRFVLVGADGVQLHEEVLHSGGWIPENGRFRRLENLTTLGTILENALTDAQPVSDPVWQRIASRWPQARDGVISAIEWRTRTRLDSLRRKLDQLEKSEMDRITEVIDQFAHTLRAKLAENPDDAEDALFSLAEAAKTQDERAQYRRDRQKWQERLDELDEERGRELARISARYRQRDPHVFPVAVVFVVPRKVAIR